MLRGRLGTWIVVACLVVAGVALMSERKATTPAESASAAESQTARLALSDIPFNGARAYEYLQQLCQLGPRTSGSEGMQQQQQLLADHFTALGGDVSFQRFRAPHPRDGSIVPMANMIVQWHPERQERIVLCAHYDTRPLPDRDPDPRKRQSGTFLGANDSGSGVAVLMEMAHLMPALESRYGVDFVFFDGEELVYREGDPYFLGSEWFSRQYVANPPAHQYRWGVLLDMVGDADLQIYQERNSMRWKETRPLVLDIWATAERLGVDDFVARRKHTVLDDHVKLRNIAKIPTCDIIDFDFGPGNRYWHTEEDRPGRCSALSLAKVGWVVHEWLRSTP